MNQSKITILSVVIFMGLAQLLFANSSDPDPKHTSLKSPNKEIASGDLWLFCMENSSQWPVSGTYLKMQNTSEGIYTVDFDASEVPEIDGFRNFLISSASNEPWSSGGYVIPHWHGSQSVNEFTAPGDKRILAKGNSGKYIQLIPALSGKYTFTLDTTGAEPTLTLTETPLFSVSVSYDGGASAELEGTKSWSDAFTLTDASARSISFTINGETYGGTWDGTAASVALARGSAPLTVQGPGIFSYTLTANSDDSFSLAITKKEYIAPVTVAVSYGYNEAKELAGTTGPWTDAFTIKTSTATTIGFTINGEAWGGAAWNGADVALVKGASPVSVQGPGIFSLRVNKDGNGGFTLSLSKTDYVAPITSLTICGHTIRQNAEQSAVYTFPAIELTAGAAVTISDNEGNTYRAATSTALADGTFALTGSKGAASNLTASADLNYLFTATVTGRTISLNVLTYKLSDSTVPAALLDNWDGSYTPEHKETIWFTSDAYNEGKQEADGDAGIGHYGHYKDVFLIGNGRIGASVIGSQSETIYISDKTNFSADLDEGNTFKEWQGGFHGMATLSVKREAPSMGYNSGQLVRQLDMTTGVVTYARHDGGTYVTQEYLCSGPYDVFGMRFDAKEGTTMSYSFGLGNITGASESFGPEYISLTGNGGSNITTACVVARVVTDGTTSSDGKTMSVAGATYLYLICGAGTDYEMNNTTFVSGQSASELARSIKAKVDAAAAVIERPHGWAQFYQESVADHSRLFNAMKFDLYDAENDRPTNELLNEYKAQSISSAAASSTPRTRMFDILLAHMGRYIAIASSRGVSDQPSNLQGTWADMAHAPWLGDYHCNINLQMNYWPSEPTGIGETHMPLFRYMKNFAAGKWKKYAENMGKKGWTHAMGLSPFGSSYKYNGEYPEGAAWNCTHIWQHYLFTLDRNFLAEYFDTLYGCCEHLADCMTTYNGKKVLSSVYSPEIGGGSSPAVHATQIAYQMVDATRKAALILGKTEQAEKLATLQSEMHDGVDIGSNGLWCEWFGVNTSASEDHRHLSHLMSLYPLDKIDPYSRDQQRFESAFQTVLARGDTDGAENSIWCSAWKTACYARCLEGDLALRQIAYAIIKKEAIYNDLRVGCKGSFQIDGSCGLSGAIPEMLLQSHRGSVEPGDEYGQLDILPALPSAWTDGSVSGLKAVGNFSVDIEWSNSTADCVTITSHSGTPLRVLMPGLQDDYHIYLNGRDITSTFSRSRSRANAPAFTSPETIAMPTAAGDVIEIHPGRNTTTGIADVEAEDSDAAPEYYNIQGMRVAHPVAGQIYIRRTGTHVEKILY